VPTRLTPLRPYGDSVAVTRNLRRVSLHSEPAAIWPEIFATDYDERVQMVADIPFYVGLARQATVRSWNWQSGLVAWRCPSLGR
jgi:hypothetical protein